LITRSGLSPNWGEVGGRSELGKKKEDSLARSTKQTLNAGKRKTKNFPSLKEGVTQRKRGKKEKS